MPTITVVVPCFRYGHYVEECVRSLLANTTVDVDVLVIDDASPDDSWDVVSALPGIDSRIRVRRHETNAGLISTANEGLAEVTSDYVALVSADDRLAPGWLDRGVAALEESPTGAFAYGPTRTFTDSVPDLALRRHGSVRTWNGREWIAGICQSVTNPVQSPEVIVRTSVQHAVGLYNPNLPYSSDMEMWLRLASVGDVVHVTGPIAAFYRVHRNNMSRGAQVQPLSELLYRRQAFDEWYEAAGDEVPDAAGLLGTARRAIGRIALKRGVLLHMQRANLADRDSLLAFAADCDKDLASDAERLAKLMDRTPVQTLRNLAYPLTVVLTQAYRALPHLRARLPVL